MKKRITLILILMATCVTCITGLQLYWNYQNYKNTVKTFDHDINEALNTAVNKEIDQRHLRIIAQCKSWLADTSFIRITCKVNDKGHPFTLFHMEDAYPLNKNEKGVYMGLTKFTTLLNQITPAAKKIFIDHFGDNILKDDLKKGIVYNYTQRLGDSLLFFFNNSKLNIGELTVLYRQELLAKDINTSFQLYTAMTAVPKLHLTQPVNTALRSPYEKEFVYAGFQSPGYYFLHTMKWLLITSFILIAVTLICFGYTVKTLLSQHKLALLKEDFINNMTHELNTPLSSIKITTEALKTFNYPPDIQKKYFDIIIYQTDKLTALTAQILNAGQLNKHILSNSTVIELNSVVETAIKDMEQQCKTSGMQIQYNASEKKLHVVGEAANLANTFTNIMDNALKYAGDKPRLDITLSANDKYAEIKFADNGMGIPPEYRDKIFDKFFRVPKGNEHNVKGYGLGLSYVWQVLKQHRGTISVTANAPYGSIFTVKLPLY